MDTGQAKTSGADYILILQMGNLVQDWSLFHFYQFFPSGSQCSIIASVPPSLEEKSWQIYSH